MADFMSDIEYLSQEIGPRPAGTEEEQRAALYITDQVNNNTNLTAEIEDITCVSNPELISVIYNAAAILSIVVALAYPPAGIICLLVALLAVGVYVTEEIVDKPILSKLLARDISQNIVAKYQPAAAAARGSRRKIIVVANYDSGKVMKEMQPAVVNVLGPVTFASNVALLASPVVVLFKGVLFPYVGGIFGGLFIILAVAAIVLIAIPLVRSILHMTAAYNEAANCNASGVAVLLEAMRQVSANGELDIDAQLDSAAKKAEGEAPVVHGEEAALEAGILPEGVELEYADDVVPNAESGEPAADEFIPEDEYAPADDYEEFEPEQPSAPAASVSDEEYESMSAAERLLAAKAAIAGLTGVAVPRNVYSPQIASASAEVEEVPEISAEEAAEAVAEVAETESETVEAVEAAATVVETVAAAAAPVVAFQPKQQEPAGAVPAWYKSAQAKANRSPVQKKVNRSRYADALDAAASESSLFFSAAPKAVDEEAEAALRSMHQGIAEVAPAAIDESGIIADAPAVVETPVAEVVETVAVAEPIQEPEQAPVVAFEAPAPVEEVVEAPAPAVEPEPMPEPEIAPEPEPMPIPQYTDNAQMRAAVAAIEEETADRTPIFNREPMPAAPAFDADFFVPFGEKLVADQPREIPQPVAPLEPVAFAEPVEEPQADLGRTMAMPPIDIAAFAANAQDTAAFPPIPEVAPRIDVDQDFQEPEVPEHEFSDMPNVVVENGEARIVLPEVGEYAPVAPEYLGQRAPLAEAEADGKAAAKSLLSGRIPKINLSELSGDLSEPIAASPLISPTDKRMNLVNNLPSLSGAIAGLGNDQANNNKTVSNTGSFNAVGSTGAFAPVGDELVADVAPEDMYIHDADDSVYENDMTETGAFAGPDYLQMPKKSRLSNFFGRFGRKKQADNEISASEWLDVDENFDARTVGRERGDWSSFRDESAGYYDEHDNWRGGAYSRGRTLVDDSDPTEANDIIPNNDPSDDYQGEEPQRGGIAGKIKGVDLGGAAAGAKDKLSSLAGMLPFGKGAEETPRRSRGERPARERSAAVRSELRQIQEFQAGEFNTEIWFVALGAEMSGEAGMKAFIKEHESELKGSIVVNLEALGAGYLSSITKEGTLKYTSPSTRLKRFTRNATQLSGVSAGTAEMTWRKSASSYAASKGLQAISLVGMDGNKPALYGQSDDVVENIDVQLLEENTQYLLALLKSI